MHEGHRERLREKFREYGPCALADHELLELLLFYALPRRDTNALAHGLIDSFGSLRAVLEAPPESLAGFPGVGKSTALYLCAVGAAMHRSAAVPKKADAPLKTAADAAEYARGLFYGETNEKLYLISLDMRFRVCGRELIASGTVDETNVYPRRIVEAALSHGAAFVILAHNHPGGSAEPSRADIDMTLFAMKLLEPIGIRVADHIIVGADGCFSTAGRASAGFSDDNSALRAAQYVRTEADKK